MSYAHIMSDWTWSYTRVKAFEQCPHSFYLKYLVREGPKVQNFFARYGDTMHKILRQFYEGGLTKEELPSEWITRFQNDVYGDVSAKLSSNYFLQGLRYLEGIKLPSESIVGVEREVHGIFSGHKAYGFVDLLKSDKENELIVTDHKSKVLTPRSTKQHRKTDDELDEYQRQLYLYANMLRQELYKPVKYIEFNCFREGLTIREECELTKELAAVKWFQQMIQRIEKEEDFTPNINYFYCKNICDMRNVCEYAQYANDA